MSILEIRQELTRRTACACEKNSQLAEVNGKGAPIRTCNFIDIINISLRKIIARPVISRVNH